MNLKVSVCIFLLFSYSPVSFAKSFSGSIAINLTTGITGSARNFSNDTEAQSNALAFCNKKNAKKQGCKSAVTFSNSCGAVAWSEQRKNAFGGWHDNNLEKAELKSLAGCRLDGGINCKVVQSFCTSWETEEVIWW